MYFYPEDYLKLIDNLDYYFSRDFEVVSSQHSKRLDVLKKDKADCYYIGLLDDIEAVLVHYKNPEIAKEKWNRRVNRINYNNLFFKFSKQNGCLDSHLRQFDSMDLPGRRFMFVNNRNDDFSCSVYYRGFENCTEILNDTFYWNRYFDVTRFLNGEGIIRK